MTVIEFDHVSKIYRLGAGQTTLREAIPQTFSRLLRRTSALHDAQMFTALNDVSFNVERGDVLGIIGHNGAGKSTILKLLSKVTFPTRGRIRTEGRVAALIELGAGFHPDLSGRENIYLNGSLLGLKKREIAAQFDSIVDFAGLEEFIDTPIKRYSSGMYVRLAFAIAAHARADVLLVDEVLSVGDTAFQQKCLDRMNELHRNGATIVFISHSMWTVQTFCKRAILLRHGMIEARGTPEEVIEVYRQYEREDLLARTKPVAQLNGHVTQSEDDAEPSTTITRVELLNRAGDPCQTFDFYDHVHVRTHYAAPQHIEAPVFLVRIRRSDGLVCCALSNRDAAEFQHTRIEGAGSFEARIGPLPLVPDVYTVETLIIDRERPIIYAVSDQQTFRIKGALSGSRESGVFAPDVRWSRNGSQE